MAFWTLIAKLGLDTASFDAGMKRATSLAVGAGTKMRSALNSTAANYLGAAAVAALTKKTIDYASTLTDVSERLAVSTEALQEFYFAAERTGGSVESVNTFLEKLAENKRKALIKPDGEIADAFLELGVTVDDLRNGRIEDLARQIGKVFETGDPQKLIGALKQVAGKGGGSMVGALVNGLSEAGNEARNLGLILETDTIAALDNVGDRATDIGKRIIASVAEPLAFVFEKIESGLDYTKRWIDVFAGFYAAFSQGVERPGKFVRDFAFEQEKARRKPKLDANKARALAAFEENSEFDEYGNPKPKKETVVQEKRGGSGGASDALAAIGGLFIGADASLRAVNEKQLSEIKRTNTILAKISNTLGAPL